MFLLHTYTSALTLIPHLGHVKFQHPSSTYNKIIFGYSFSHPIHASLSTYILLSISVPPHIYHQYYFVSYLFESCITASVNYYHCVSRYFVFRDILTNWSYYLIKHCLLNSVVKAWIFIEVCITAYFNFSHPVEYNFMIGKGFREKDLRFLF